MNKNINSSSLSNKVISSTIWLSFFQILDNVLGLIRIIVLARLLSPTAFGVVGAAWLTLQIINTFTFTGIQHFLIQKQRTNEYLNTAWTFLLLRGIILFLIILVAAPYIGLFFNTTEVIPVIQALSVTILINGFGNIGIVFFQKDLEFNKQFRMQITQNTVDFVVTIILAIYLHSVWAIVFGAIANSVIGFIMSYLISSYRPKFEFNLKKMKTMNDYGKWIGGSHILEFLFGQGDDILVGKLLGVTSLGYYQLAYKISNLPATQITHIISTVMFPAYSKMQNDLSKLREIYLKNLQITVFLSFFVGTMIILFARDFTMLFLGENWIPIVFSLQTLTAWGIIRSIGATTGPIWQATGKPKYITYIQTIQVLILACIIIPFTITLGFNGTSIAVVIACIIPNIIAIYFIMKTLSIEFNKIIKELIYPLIATIPVILIHMSNINFIIFNSLFISFIINATISVLAYLFMIYIMNKYFTYTLFENIAGIIPRLNFLKNL